MTQPNVRQLLPQLVDLARRAGDAILAVYAGDIAVTTKDDASPLTQADLASHRVIRAALAELTPDIPLLSEESAEIPFATRRRWSEYWLVDPLDGTREFINRNGEFTVNIALVREHRPVLGVVHVPVRGQTYWGVVGDGAWKQDGGSEPVSIHTRRPPAEVPIVVGSRSHANPKLEAALKPIGEHQMVSMGSSLKFCLVAEGAADLYPRLGPTSEWDTAAAQAVVEAAGGRVLELDGAPLSCNQKDSYLNPWFIVVGDPDAGWMERLALSD
jgi:3'(2'), 5'-bisphosphate nucleotidase